MKKHHIERIVLFVSLITILGGCAGCAGCAGNEIPSTPTPAITATVAPTEKPVKISPTGILATPTAVPDPTLEPTATPAPTSTPVPTVVVAPEAKLLDSIKMGDNVWYDFYDEGTLVVRGTGKTRDFKDAKKMYSFFVDEHPVSDILLASTIIIEEGVTEIGQAALSNFIDATKIYFPTSLEVLKDESLSALGYNSGNVEIIGLNVDKVDIASTAFVYCGSPEKIPNNEKYTATPTPTPAPTATPLPNPDKPRKYATKQMGDNVTFEFWDNGYLYVKGTGATWDKEWNFCEFRDTPYNKTKIVVVEEGVTYLGDHCLAWLEPKEIHFPESLSKLGNIGTWATIHGVRDGRKYVAKGGYIYTFFEYFENESLASEHGCTITFE